VELGLPGRQPLGEVARLGGSGLPGLADLGEGRLQFADSERESGTGIGPAGIRFGAGRAPELGREVPHRGRDLGQGEAAHDLAVPVLDPVEERPLASPA
jgi:hypothetical protein